MNFSTKAHIQNAASEIQDLATMIRMSSSPPLTPEHDEHYKHAEKIIALAGEILLKLESLP